MRQQHARRRALWRELSTYTSIDDLNDIEAAIDRCDEAATDPQTAEIRRFIAAQRNVARRG